MDHLPRGASRQGASAIPVLGETHPTRTTAPTEIELAILGAGPIGLEAALAAAEAGIGFVLIEQANRVAHSMRCWGHVRLFSPWSIDVSPRQRAALSRVGIDTPNGDLCPTGGELVERVLEPVAGLPQIAPHLRLGTRVVAVAREGLTKAVEIGSPARAAARFRLLLEDAGGESLLHAARVFDCTGSYEHPGWLGDGGIPALGERAAADRIVRRLPDLASEAPTWNGRRVLLVGSGHSAQTAAVALASLVRESPETLVHWVLRRPEPAITPDPDDPLPGRRHLHEQARALLDGASPRFEIHRGATVDRLVAEDDGSTRVGLRAAGSADRTELTVDRVLALVGSHGDRDLYAELQVHECYATGGPMKLAAQLLASSSDDCMAQESAGPDVLRTPEVGFFLLGSKSYGRNSAFLMRLGWDQVDDAIGLLTARAQPSGV